MKMFNLKVIPILNPDGVFRGYWRNDTQGLNLNRFYDSPTLEAHPTIVCTKHAILKEHAEGRLKYFIDLHGHCSKKSCFIFGNSIPDQEKHIT
mmetsp:Transcript_29167/g.21712  ORF Transcript_29167/g.21712 Transcript_29167/m.21712 type:complete len:93 (+) Transcript_29167:876-1154(+)